MQALEGVQVIVKAIQDGMLAHAYRRHRMGASDPSLERMAHSRSRALASRNRWPLHKGCRLGRGVTERPHFAAMNRARLVQFYPVGDVAACAWAPGVPRTADLGYSSART